MKFHIGDVISIITGKLVSPTHMEGIYKILNFLTGQELWTHQLPDASRFATPYLLQQFPELKEIDKNSINTTNWKEQLQSIIEKYGEYRNVETIKTEWDTRDPLEDRVHISKAFDLIIINK